MINIIHINAEGGQELTIPLKQKSLITRRDQRLPDHLKVLWYSDKEPASVSVHSFKIPYV